MLFRSGGDTRRVYPVRKETGYSKRGSDRWIEEKELVTLSAGVDITSPSSAAGAIGSGVRYDSGAFDVGLVALGDVSETTTSSRVESVSMMSFVLLPFRLISGVGVVASFVGMDISSSTTSARDKVSSQAGITRARTVYVAETTTASRGGDLSMVLGVLLDHFSLTSIWAFAGIAGGRTKVSCSTTAGRVHDIGVGERVGLSSTGDREVVRSIGGPITRGRGLANIPKSTATSRLQEVTSARSRTVFLNIQ